MSTGTAPRRPATVGRGASGPAHPFVGTGVLLRLLLRRDRVRFPGWTVGITLLVVYFTTALDAVFETDEDLQAMAGFAEGPIGGMLGGPGHGYDALTLERFIVGQYGLYIIIAAALMSLLTIIRHTRAEERGGRAELVGANVVGRHAQTTAAVIVMTMMNVVVTVLCSLVLVGKGFEAHGSWLFAASIGAGGLVFGGVAVLTAQISEYPRAAAGIAGAVLGAAFVVRGLGDTLETGGSWVSWLSPIGWSQQTRAYVDERWWPLTLSVLAALALTAVGYLLSGRRDHAAGLRPPRRGAPAGPAWLNGPLALAFRLQRASLVGWSAALLVAGFAYGMLAQPLVDGFEDGPEDLLAVMGGGEDLLRGYLALMAVMMALTVAVFAILAVQALRAEEYEGRSEPVLATAVSRAAWMGSHLGVVALGAVALLVVAGAGTGFGAAVSMDDGSLFGEVVLAHVVHAPAVWVVLAVAALLYGSVPRALPAVWAMWGHAMIVAFFAPLLDLPDVASNVSVFEHVAELPLEELTVVPIAVLAALAAVVTVVAGMAFRHRDLRSS